MGSATTETNQKSHYCSVYSLHRVTVAFFVLDVLPRFRLSLLGSREGVG